MKNLRVLAALFACGLAAGPALAQSMEDFRQGNEATQRQLDRGHDAMQQQLNRNTIMGMGSPPFPLFRCDGQRPPVFGAENCPNWQFIKKQEQLIDLQIKELQARQKARGAKQGDD